MPEAAPLDQASDVLCAQGLACRRGERLLFTGLDLSIAPGTLTLVEGANGIGKSSLLRIIAGLLRPFAGEVQCGVGLALCDDRMPLDAEQPLAMALDYWRRTYRQDDGRLAEICAQLDLSGLREVPVGYLSTGQQQRARLACTMLSGAVLWLLDEPANGLDSNATEMLGLVIADHLAGGGAVLATSHIGLPLTPDLTVRLAEYAP